MLAVLLYSISVPPRISASVSSENSALKHEIVVYAFRAVVAVQSAEPPFPNLPQQLFQSSSHAPSLPCPAPVLLMAFIAIRASPARAGALVYSLVFPSRQNADRGNCYDQLCSSFRAASCDY